MRHISRKVIWLEALTIVMLTVIMAVSISTEHFSQKQVGHLAILPGDSILYFDKYDISIHGFDKDGVTFFFLPSYIDVDNLDQSESEYKICSADGSELDKPMINQIQEIFVYAPDGSMSPWKLGIFEAENLYTMRISMEDMEFYEVDHDIYSDASLTMYSLCGESVYYEKCALVKGRGNGSWPMDNELAIDEKRPFQIKLPEKVSFCGMRRSDKWALIPNDETGLRNKLTYDLSGDIGMEYAIESDWIDVYFNDEYMGLYLLCHEPGVGGEDLDIGNITSFNSRYIEDADIIEAGDIKGYDYSIGNSFIPDGGYLIEKNMPVRYYRKRSGFKCNDDYFTIKSPNNASLDEVSYIRSFTFQVDETIHDSKDKRLSMIDAYSFARQYLISEISLNPDAAITSYFFYKKPGVERLYAGPCWDYDGAFGEFSDCRNYTADIKDIYQYRIENGEIPLDWDLCLLENDEYNNYVDEVFGIYTHVYEKLLMEDLYDYQIRIYSSLCMDHLRWIGNNYETEIRNENKYLEFFLYNRFKYLADSHGVTMTLTEPDIYEDTKHTLMFLYPDGTIKEMVVNDGTQLNEEEMPQYNHSLYKGWHVFENGMVHGLLSYYDPIFEDKDLVLGDYSETFEEKVNSD